MKAFNYILISFLILSSCSQEKKSLNEFYSHDFKKYQVDSEFEIVDLDSMTNYSDLRKKMEKLNCESKISGLRFALFLSLFSTALSVSLVCVSLHTRVNYHTLFLWQPHTSPFSAKVQTFQLSTKRTS